MPNNETWSMTLNQALRKWQSNKLYRKYGCRQATKWLCKRVKGFRPLTLRRYLPNGNDKNGNFWEHTVATNDLILIDLVPHCDYSNDPTHVDLPKPVYQVPT